MEQELDLMLKELSLKLEELSLKLEELSLMLEEACLMLEEAYWRLRVSLSVRRMLNRLASALDYSKMRLARVLRWTKSPLGPHLRNLGN
jgi:hypothetical protein